MLVIHEVTIVLVSMIVFCCDDIQAMEFTRANGSKLSYVVDRNVWKYQIVKNITMVDGDIQSAIKYIIPQITNLDPIIGSASCTCEKIHDLLPPEEHRRAVIFMFKTILFDLASQGFNEVHFSKKMYDGPVCLVDHLEKLDVRTHDGFEYITSTTVNIN